jgi:NTP pyrophosphatase (non-canonical NTP hydrolase)
MTPNEYQQLAGRTLSDETIKLSQYDLRLLWNAIGVAGECGEVLKLLMFPVDKKKWIGELGDVAWYASACATVLDLAIGDWIISPTSLPDLKYAATGLARTGAEIVEMTKKQVFHKHGIEKDKWAAKLIQLFGHLQVCCNALAISPSDVFEANIEKLKARYPDGWDISRTKFREGVAA